MIRIGPILLVAGLIIGTVFLLIVPQWTLPVAGTSLGWRSSSMIQFAPSDKLTASMDHPPPALPPAKGDTRPASEVYKNVKVLTDLNAAEFMRMQQAITQWVSPQQGCGFCHEGADYASDTKPAKNVARLMLQMTRHINASWKDHIANTGVTCYMCHRGQPVPDQVWFPRIAPTDKPFIDKAEDWNVAATTVRKFFPTEGPQEYLLENTPALAQSYTALPTGEVSSQIVAKRLYEVMMEMSDGMGVNCGFCHNSRAFFDWQQSTPYRWTGWNGITMTRDLNRNWLLEVGKILPENRRPEGQAQQPVVQAREQGPLYGNALADCATCHHGAPVPLGGANMLVDYPSLGGPAPPPRQAVERDTPAAPYLTVGGHQP